MNQPSDKNGESEFDRLKAQKDAILRRGAAATPNAYRWIEEASNALREARKLFKVYAIPRDDEERHNAAIADSIETLLSGVPCPQVDLGFDSPADRASRSAIGLVQPHDVDDALRWGMHRGEVKAGDPQRAEIAGAFDFNSVAEYLNGAFAKSARSHVATINQCDGCQRGLPIRGNGIHYDADFPTGMPVMACTKDRYVQSSERPKSILTTATEPQGREVTQGEARLHHPAPEREGEIAGRESLDPEGPATARLLVERAASGRAERLDGGERPAPLSARSSIGTSKPERVDTAELVLEIQNELERMTWTGYGTMHGDLLRRAAEALAAPVSATGRRETALQQFTEHMGKDDATPLERLRFFCSLAFREPQDWLDVEPFFDAVEAQLRTTDGGGA